MHEHGWDCFRESGGYTNALESSTPLAERIEKVYKTAYATGFKNGKREAQRQERLPVERGGSMAPRANSSSTNRPQPTSNVDLDSLERRALAWPGNNLQPEIHALAQQLRELEAGFDATNEALSAAEARIAQLERVREAAQSAANLDFENVPARDELYAALAALNNEGSNEK